ncbi:hypothetical protein HBDW_11610 [Herbaspirillum sp. DW155]|uniref:hypothetical protein n=1 Tax=Herbaspirillum sp. DW155 TaxID=3095609 RepID=UPI00308AA4E5|nr:hypothetical protein HBDW_11610 [Herbaspirillum sp. DW155]
MINPADDMSEEDEQRMLLSQLARLNEIAQALQEIADDLVLQFQEKDIRGIRSSAAAALEKANRRD